MFSRLKKKKKKKKNINFQHQIIAVFRSNLFDVSKSSMSQLIEYFVKYSVAPPPSRDYYGLKVCDKEVILYLWRISHGPHKTPIIYHTEFAEFNEQKSLQDEIRHVFGEYLLKHVRNITQGNRNTLLTLPKFLIEKISSYLKITDIIKLSSLSHVAYEVFNADSIWQILYIKNKEGKVDANERDKAKVYGWKYLYKDKQMQSSMRNQRDHRLHSSIKCAIDTNTGNLSLRPISGKARSISKSISTMNITINQRQNPIINLPTDPLFKLNVQPRHSRVTNDEKLQNRNTTNVDPAFKINKKAVKKEDLSTSKIISKQGIGCVSKFDRDVSNKKQHKFENYINKSNNVNIKSQKGKTKVVSSRALIVSPKSTGNIKCSSDLTKSSYGKIRSKSKTKPNRSIGARSEILNFDKELSDNPFTVGKNNIDLADLIEASLKNIRSPRNIFDYDFSYLQQPNTAKSTSEVKKEIFKFNQLKDRKPSRHNIILDYFSNKIIRGDRILEKLSERSEPFSSRSSNLLLKNQKHSSNKGDRSMSISKKYSKVRAEFKKSLSSKQEDNSMPFNVNKTDLDLYTNLKDKSFHHRKIGNITGNIAFSRGPSKTSGKAYLSNN